MSKIKYCHYPKVLLDLRQAALIIIELTSKLWVVAVQGRVFDINWATPEAQGAFYQGQGDVHVSREAIILHSLASSFSLTTKIHTLYPPIVQKQGPRVPQFKPAATPTVTGLDVDMRLDGFDLMGVHPLLLGETFSPSQPMHMKVFGKIKFNGRVPDTKIASQESSQSEFPLEKKLTSMIGEVSLVGLKLNQFMVAPNLTGSLDISSTSLKVSSEFALRCCVDII